ncbi:hypothetical protein AK812_SmicGene14792 [Symbiodinium microadriaticum]|uniref:Uncharacterized protein n=1 Tax=Symbiodinium microadriaticum TaxID=2951 RepID=A0A1Q9E4L4_SYMMI|nr:hypothetical protein AK812_SmicGene14792 [Symbiodinium microadriaticum]
MLLLVRETLMLKGKTHDRIGEVVGWIQRVLQTGKFPNTNIDGKAWAAGSIEASRANRDFAGGYKFAFSAFKGDWEARVQIHKLQRSYLHNNICEHCPACKTDNAFNYRNFAPDAPYTQVCFTHAQYLLMNPPELHSSWVNVPGWTKGVACLVVPSLVCAHIEKKIGDGIRLQDLNSELEGRVWKHYKIWCRQCKVPGCGHRFNLSRFGRESWVTYPELHSCYKAYTVKMMIYWVHAFLSDEDVGVPGGDDRIHVSYSLSKMQWLFDRSGSFLATSVKEDAVRWEHCYQDEDLMKQIGNIASSTHPFTMDKVSCSRYRAMLEFGDIW